MQYQAVLQTIQDIVVNRFVVALFILLVGLLLGRVVNRVVQKVMKKWKVDATLKKAIKIQVPLTDIISMGLMYIIFFVAVVMALENLGIATQVLNIISLGIVALLLFIIFLSVKDFLPNAVAGMFIHYKGFINQGDHIKVDDLSGKVVYLNLVETRIKKKNGDVIYLPNSRLTKSKVIKKS